MAKYLLLGNNIIPMQTSEAFLLRKIEYGEADYIISLFTRDFGKIKGLAKNAKKSRKRFGGRLEPFVYFRVRFREKQTGIKFIEDCETIRVFSIFREDIELFTWGSFILENIDVLLPEEEPNDKIFELLVETLSSLDSNKSPIPVILKFQLSLLFLSGYKPNFDTCAECGRIVEDGFFSINKGAIVCKKCWKDKSNGFSMSENFQLKADSTEDNLESVFSRIKLLSKFKEYHTGKEIKSSKFLEEITR